MAKTGIKTGRTRKTSLSLGLLPAVRAAYYRVSVNADQQGKFLIPREDRPRRSDDGSNYAYLYLSESAPWPRTEGAELLDRLPAFMKETLDDGSERLRRDYRRDLPEPVFVDAGGRLVSEDNGSAATLIHRISFLPAPGCGVAYTKTQRSERGKLGTLGVDNRSTATTILAVRALIELQGEFPSIPRRENF